MGAQLKNSRNATGWIKVGKALRKKGDIARACEAFGKAVALDPMSWDAWFDFGDILEIDGKQPQALFCYDWVAALGFSDALQKAKALRDQGVTPVDPTLKFEEKWVAEEEEQKKFVYEEENPLQNPVIADRRQKIIELLRVTRRMKIEQVAKYLGLPTDEIFPKLVGWANEFGFILDQDEVIFEESPLSLTKKLAGKIHPSIQLIFAVLFFVFGFVAYNITGNAGPNERW